MKDFVSENREFKYIVQDVSHIYVGAKMTIRNYIEYEDIPFKVKAVANKYFLPKVGNEGTICDYFGSISKDDFDFQAIKQLNLKVKAGFFTEKTDKKGNIDRKYKSKVYSASEYMDLIREREDVITEELIFNKLALMTFST